MPRVQVFQHAPHEGLGSLESALAELGAPVDYTRWFDGDDPPPTAVFDLLIVMGGPMGTYEEEAHPWLRTEKMALMAALDAGRPVLGICLGAQLLAEALGAGVTRNAHKEIGWWPVERLPTADSWVADLFPDGFTTFHWHGDTFSNPPGAVPLFRSEGCAHQGFVWKERAVGLQFHPEITPEASALWVNTGADELTPGLYVQSPDQILGRPEDYAANNGWAAALCRELARMA